LHDLLSIIDLHAQLEFMLKIRKYSQVVWTESVWQGLT